MAAGEVFFKATAVAGSWVQGGEAYLLTPFLASFGERIVQHVAGIFPPNTSSIRWRSKTTIWVVEPGKGSEGARLSRTTVDEMAGAIEDRYW